MQSQGSKKRSREPDDECEAAISGLPGSTPHAHNRPPDKRVQLLPESDSAQHLTVHRVFCLRNGRYHEKHQSHADYLDVPRLRASANRTTALQGLKQLSDTESYLEDHDGISLVIYVNYSCEAYHESLDDSFTRTWMPQMDEDVRVACKPYFHVLLEDGPQADATSEVMVLSINLQEALHQLREQHSNALGEWHIATELAHPYLQLYNYKHLFKSTSTLALDLLHQTQLSVLFGYLTDNLTSEYEEAEAYFREGLTTQKHWNKLCSPGEIVVTVQDGQPRAYTLVSRPSSVEAQMPLQCWSWEFDGNFFRKDITLMVVWPSKAKKVLITGLSVYPLRYADEDLVETLRSRGKTFWGCRERNYVSYNAPLQGIGTQIANLRYMVDIATFKLMHSEDDEVMTKNEISDEEFKSSDPPEGSFALMLPATIRGFGFHNKKWNLLQVEHIRDITWNTGIFEDRLVLKEDKKELVRALVTVHIGKIHGTKTDFMDGKGEGLIILLHGGPGTGKTLTAESIAELVERPLYRVTCGDIGTDPEGVEKYLESVLHIGSTWDCVVLLDEADVFLEERTKMDLQRNALVSVFLRVLEYYDGILVLTTNRIGTFDEAFKSRVQLALHYPPLNREGRWEVWRNFVRSLLEGGENIDHEGIKEKLDVLAKHTLNGRQIRNTINTARQLALYKKEKLRYRHINQAVGVVNEFEKYVSDTHGHDDEEYAREQGWRAE